VTTIYDLLGNDKLHINKNKMRLHQTDIARIENRELIIDLSVNTLSTRRALSLIGVKVISVSGKRFVVFRDEIQPLANKVVFKLD